MALSAFDLYSVGIGPSSSHTVGPMRAAKRFADGLVESGRLHDVRRIRAELFGSLGATGHGHGSPKAVVLGLEGEDPATTDTDRADSRLEAIRSAGTLRLAGTTPVPFDLDEDLVMHRRRSLPAHPNGMTFAAYDASDAEIRCRTYYSVGGGFVVDAQRDRRRPGRGRRDAAPLPVHHRRGAARDLRPRGLLGQRRDAGQRAGLAHRGGDPSRACSISGR